MKGAAGIDTFAQWFAGWISDHPVAGDLEDELEAAWNAGYDTGHADATDYYESGGTFR